MKHLIIYHANCMDGFGAAWAAYTGIDSNSASDVSFRTAYDEIQLWPASYGEPWPANETSISTQIHIVDFSYPPEIIEEMLNCVESVRILDHHKTAIEKFNYGYNIGWQDTKNLLINFNVGKSGAMLAWEYYHPNEEVPKLIQHIQDRDLWKFEMMNTKAFHLNLSTFPKEIGVWSEINTAIENEDQDECNEDYYDNFISQGNAIDRYYQQTIQSIISSTKRTCQIDNLRGLSCNTNGMFASDIGNILAKETGTWGMTWDHVAGTQVKFSLRSIGEFDVAKIAESFGGGGHKNAAGFTLNWASDADQWARMS